MVCIGVVSAEISSVGGTVRLAALMLPAVGLYCRRMGGNGE
jgi:hypothetical protein